MEAGADTATGPDVPSSYAIVGHKPLATRFARLAQGAAGQPRHGEAHQVAGIAGLATGPGYIHADADADARADAGAGTATAHTETSAGTGTAPDAPGSQALTDTELRNLQDPRAPQATQPQPSGTPQTTVARISPLARLFRLSGDTTEHREHGDSHAQWAASPSPSARSGRLRSRIVASALLIAALFAVIQAIDYRQDVPSNDTYQYARQTLRILGDSQAQAVHGAVVMFCQDAGQSAARSATLDYGSSGTGSAYESGYAHCLHTYRNGLTPSSPRYIAIFTSRPGYPLLAAPFAAAFGLRFGLWLTALLCTLAGGFLVLALLRAAGCGRPAALSGQALYLAAPTGYWGSRMLTEGPSLAATLLTLLGAWWLVRRRFGPGVTALVLGFAGGFAVRYSSEQLIALLLTLGALACLAWVRSARHRGTMVLAAASGGSFLLSELLSTLLGWPGMSESLQDTFTRHFIRPDVADPVSRLVHLDLRFWGYYPVSQPTALLAAAALTALAVLLVRRAAVYGVLVIAAAASGVCAVAAHPLASQADRLMVPVWLLLALGLPPLLPHRPPTRPAEPAPEPRPEPAFSAGTP